MLQHEFVYGYKQSLRRDDDIAIVNAGMRVVVNEEDRKWQVKEMSLVYEWHQLQKLPVRLNRN